MSQINKGQGKNNSNNNRTKCQNCGNFHKKDACWAKRQRCNICHKVGHFSKVCQERQQGAAQGHIQRRFIPKQKPNSFGGKNDNLYIIDSIEFSLDPDTGKLKYNSKHSNVEINQVLQTKTWKEVETTILMYPSDDKGKINRKTSRA